MLIPDIRGEYPEEYTRYTLGIIYCTHTYDILTEDCNVLYPVYSIEYYVPYSTLAVYIILKMFTLYNRKFNLCMLHGYLATARGRVLDYT